MLFRSYSSKVVNTVPVWVVLVDMYCTGTYIDIETSIFRIGLNTGRTGHVPTNFEQYRPVPGILVGIEFFFFFLSL